MNDWKIYDTTDVDYILAQSIHGDTVVEVHFRKGIDVPFFDDDDEEMLCAEAETLRNGWRHFAWLNEDGETVAAIEIPKGLVEYEVHHYQDERL